MTEEALVELKAKIKRADELKALINRLARAIDKFTSATAVWFGIESGDFCAPGHSQNVVQSRLSNADLYREISGDDIPGMAADIRATIAEELTARKHAAEKELAEL